MNAEKKKPILLGIVVVCLILAGGITYLRSAKGPEGVDSLRKGEMIWVKCANPNCNAEYEMEKREYYDPAGRRSSSATPKCKQCGEESLYDAIKCEKCGIVFISGSLKDEIKDRCPECGFSKIKGDTKSVK